jgi:hypothetical protein
LARCLFPVKLYARCRSIPTACRQDAKALRQIVLDLAEQLDRAFAEQHKYESLLRELLEAQRNRKSEQLSKEQLALFEAAWQARNPDEPETDEDDDDFGSGTQGGQKGDAPNRTGNGAHVNVCRDI